MTACAYDSGKTVEEVATDPGDASLACGVIGRKTGGCLDCRWDGAACGATRQHYATHRITGITARLGEFGCDQIGGIARTAFDRPKLCIFQAILGTVDRQLAAHNIAAHAAKQGIAHKDCMPRPVPTHRPA